MPHKYWTREDERVIKTVGSYAELCEVAMRILARIKGPVGFVCGPISTGGTGSPKKNIVIFKRYIAKLCKEGKNIFNQMPFEKTLWRLLKVLENPEDRLLQEFYLPLFKSGKLTTFYFIHGWETSYGARWEHKQAKRLGIRCVYLKRSMK